MGRVVVVGSINDDLVVGAERLPAPGETVAGTDVRHAPGGKGANQAVAAARAGAATALVGCVGGDEAGDRLVAGLVAAGVDVDPVGRVDGPTGVAVVTVAGGENTIVVVPGANARLDVAALERVRIDPGDVVVAQLETPPTATIEAFRRARAVGATTVLNPAPAAPLPSPLLALVDHLVVNEHEVEIVLGVRAADLVAGDEGAVAAAREATAATVHLTLGAAGVLVLDRTGALAVAGRPVTVVDSTGAGDCFTGSLAAGIAAGLDPRAAATEANAAAALSVTHPGAQAVGRDVASGGA